MPTTLPAPLGASLCTGGDARMLVLQLVTLSVTALVWCPFFRAYDLAVARTISILAVLTEQKTDVELDGFERFGADPLAGRTLNDYVSVA